MSASSLSAGTHVCLESVQASCTLSRLLSSYVSPVVDEDNVSLKSSITSSS